MKFGSTVLAVLTVAGAAHFAAAADCCCQHCGCKGPCRKVTCRVVCDVKKEKHYFYACECEDFCLPGPGRKISACCDGCAGSVDKPSDPPCGGCLPKFCENHCEAFIFKPAYCHVNQRKRLVKYESEKEVPVYKCVVVDLCPGCRAQVSECGEGQSVEDMKEAPAIDAKKAPKEGEKPMPPKLPSARRTGLLDLLFPRSR